MSKGEPDQLQLVAYKAHLCTLSEDSTIKATDRCKLTGYLNKWTDAKCLLYGVHRNVAISHYVLSFGSACSLMQYTTCLFLSIFSQV